MGRSRYKILDERYPYFITSSIVNRYPLFTKEEFIQIVINGLNFLVDNRGIDIYAYVIMPDHIHLIAQGNELGKHVARFKSYSARKTLDILEANKMHGIRNTFKETKRAFKTDREHQFWSEGFHPKQIFNPDVMRQKMHYVHRNPVKAGLADQELDWRCSSYGDYYGDSSGLVKITLFTG